MLRPVNAADEAEGHREQAARAILAGFAQAVDQLAAARRAEGTRLAAMLAALLGEIAALRDQAAAEAADQPAAQRVRLMENLQRCCGKRRRFPRSVSRRKSRCSPRAPTCARLYRLASHIEAAHALLAEAAGIGRRFDFLVQEFNREANTL